MYIIIADVKVVSTTDNDGPYSGCTSGPRLLLLDGPVWQTSVAATCAPSPLSQQGQIDTKGNISMYIIFCIYTTKSFVLFKESQKATIRKALFIKNTIIIIEYNSHCIHTNNVKSKGRRWKYDNGHYLTATDF